VNPARRARATCPMRCPTRHGLDIRARLSSAPLSRDMKRHKFALPFRTPFAYLSSAGATNILAPQGLQTRQRSWRVLKQSESVAWLPERKMHRVVQNASGVSSEYSSRLCLYLHRHWSRLLVHRVRPGDRHPARCRGLRAAATPRLLLRLHAAQTSLCGGTSTRSPPPGSCELNHTENRFLPKTALTGQRQPIRSIQAFESSMSTQPGGVRYGACYSFRTSCTTVRSPLVRPICPANCLPSTRFVAHSSLLQER
jgi:hypothetical protein